MHSILKTSKSHDQNGSSRVVLWVLGLLVFLGLVYLAGIWTGKQVVEQQEEDRELQIEQEKIYRTQVITDYQSEVLPLSEEERQERMQIFFNQ